MNMFENKGWKCPTCGYTWAPFVSGCANCNRPDSEKYFVTDRVSNSTFEHVVCIGVGFCNICGKEMKS